MGTRSTSFRVGRLALLAGLVWLTAGLAVWALEPKEPGDYLDSKAFFKPELYISSENVPLAEILGELPNRAAWEKLQGERESLGKALPVAWVDPRSGAASNLIVSIPMIPGRGVGNRVKLGDLSKRLGQPVEKVTPATVVQLVLQYVQSNAGLLGLDPTQLGTARVSEVTSELWQISIPQTYKGVTVRDSRLGASINNGNLVVIGTEVWGDVKGLSTKPTLSTSEALAAGWAYVGGTSALDQILRQPTLEILPVAPQKLQKASRFVGKVGQGYGHRLVWSYTFRRPPEEAVWEVLVDAHDGEVLALQDLNHYSTEQITGGVYPLTNTEICPSPGTCGTMQSGWPMPFTDTGLASPNNFTNSAGVFEWPGGTVTTTLSGRFVDIVDSCGTISESSSTGSLDLGGTNGDHDCVVPPGSSLGNTASSRSAFYEVNKLAEQARGWLPTNVWLQNQLRTNVNLNLTCNAFYSPSAGTINFYRSGGGCRNTGEIAGVFDHEWGHAMDDNDTVGALSNSSEGYADIAAIYRLQTSCVGHGFFWTSNRGCGMTADGTGFNSNEAQVGAAHCDLDCSGVRDADWDKHADHTPDTALGFVCNSCGSGTGPCGRQVHCAAAPTRQAAWDLVARDLRGAPFNLDSQSAFIVGNKLFYQGSGNIGAWHACTCGSSSSGCGATNGYMQWITADDDNGNLNDGTPHMTAIFDAFNRHGIACATPTPQNSGCAGGPSGAATLTATPGNYSAGLSWTSVSGATRYWVFRTEGHAGCDFGKTLIAETTATSFTDTEVANGRAYSYNVVAAGASSACYGPVSNCATVTPAAGPPPPDFSVSCAPSSLSIPQGSSGGSTCTVSSTGGFNSSVGLSCLGQPAGISCSFVPGSVTPPANGSANSSLTVNVAGSTATGTYNFQVQGTSGAAVRTTNLSVEVTGVCAPRGASCVDNADCCSGSCKGKPGAKTCK